MTVSGAVPVPVPMSLPMPAPRVAALLDAPTMRIAAGRSASRSRRSALTVAVDVVGRAGSIVTLAAALVVGGAVGGLADGTTPSGTAGAISHTTLGDR